MANIRRAIRTALITHLLPFLVLPLIIGIVNGRGHARKKPVIERPIHLTDMTDGIHSTAYNVRDQCMLRPAQERINSYGLRLFLRAGILCDGEGLLICYPGQLDGTNTVTGLVTSINRRVYNDMGPNPVKDRCRQKRKEFCDAEPEGCKDGNVGVVDFHGIWLRTVNGSIQMRLSIAPYIYLIGARENFLIEFGNEHSLFTTIRLPFQNRMLTFREDDAIRDAYMRDVVWGSFFYKYAGLWMLATDVLPNQFEQEIHLFVYRDCSCAMEAWFTKPTHLMHPVLPKKISIGHDQCPARYTNSTFNIAPVQEGTKIVFNLILDGQPQQIALTLFDINGAIIFNVTIQPERVQFGPDYIINLKFQTTLHLKGNALEMANNQTWLAADKNKIVELQFHPYYYGVAIGDGASGTGEAPVMVEQLWPELNWWEKLPYGTIGSVHFAGDGLLINKPMLVPGNMPLIKPASFKLTDRIDQLGEINIKGYVKPNAKQLEIQLLHNSPVVHSKVGLVFLAIHVDFVDKRISWGSQYNGESLNAEKFANVSDKLRAEPFECNIKLFRVNKRSSGQDTSSAIANIYWLPAAMLFGNFTVANGRMPVWTLNWIRFVGDMKLMQEPTLDAHVKADPRNKKYELPRLLNYNDTLCFKGKAKNSFTISLLHESSEFSEHVGDMPLEIKFDNTAKKIALNRFSRRNFVWRKQDWFLDIQNISNPIVINDTITVSIEAERHRYRILINDNLGLPIYSPTEDPDVSYLPAYAVNWINLKGDVEQFEMIECEKMKKEPFAPLPRWIKQIPKDEPIVPGMAVRIQGEIQQRNENNTAEANKITISFYNAAIGWDPYIGHTIFQANFSIGTGNNTLTINSYIGQQWQQAKNYTLDPPLQFGQPFDVRILATRETMVVQLAENEKIYSYNMTENNAPLWAIQYITVKGGIELENEGTIVQLTNDIRVWRSVKL